MILAPSSAAYDKAAQVLRDGGIVAHPTETVYGLAVDPFNEDALRALFAAKGRPETNPVLLIVSDASQLHQVVADIPDAARELMTRFWPGPLSLIFPAVSTLPEAVTAGTGTVCVRCPDNEYARGIAAAFGGAITSTSANLSGEAPARDIAGAMLPGVALGIDAGTLPPSAPSTIYDPVARRVLREGAISRAALGLD